MDTTATPPPLAAAVDAARRDRGLSLESTAAAAGIGYSSLRRLLAGQLDVSAATAVRAGLAVGLSPTALGRLLAQTFPLPPQGGKEIREK